MNAPEAQPPTAPPSAASLAAIGRESRAYAQGHDGRATWQVSSTLLLTLSTLVVSSQMPWGPRLLLVPVLAGLLIRLFVLQHDCGHRSLFRGRALNDRVGALLGALNGVPFHAWRSEHNWHHAHQGDQAYWGVDTVNTPMTVEQAASDPKAAETRSRLIGPATVFGLGFFSLIIRRKFARYYFQFRETFRWPCHYRPSMRRSVHWTVLVHLLLQAGLLQLMGPAWLFGFYWPSIVVGGGIGATLFWVQHNFEHTYHAPTEDWSYLRVGLDGSSYLSLPQPLRWFTGDIGLHHVHHVNPGIPNYRLEEARRGIPALARKAPLRLSDVRRSYSHVFWDGRLGRMVDDAGLPRP